MNFDDKIKELKIELPEAKAPVGSYVATKISGKLLYVSGQISMNSSGELIKGKVGKDLTTDEAYKAAERCGLSIVAQVKKACDGNLSKVKSCIKLTGFVNSKDDFMIVGNKRLYVRFVPKLIDYGYSEESYNEMDYKRDLDTLIYIFKQKLYVLKDQQVVTLQDVEVFKMYMNEMSVYSEYFADLESTNHSENTPIDRCIRCHSVAGYVLVKPMEPVCSYKCAQLWVKKKISRPKV